ncbi:thiolase family protein [Streptomyces sp. SRF1]|uniref:thiolase family protein n=1 Tax=Streptomyces sp. SRF1 TaxID=1549642 RepID=UPI0025B01D4E|nr:thiolase family protein [Streptomyces sp. SRF1]MDN3059776.1 thiolase family protein [Streptomyces sp. SRF1]
MPQAVIAGAGSTTFGRFPSSTVRSLASDAARHALSDAGVAPDQIEQVYFSNAASGLLTGQEMIRGQVALRDLGLSSVPVINVENACASGSTAVHLAATAIAAGEADIVLVVGSEKLTHEDKARTFAALGSAVDLERLDQVKADLYGEDLPTGDRSFFMDVYADMATTYMKQSGATASDFAAVAAKSHRHAALNPYAAAPRTASAEEVAASRHVSGPLTLLMCSPISDGASAVVMMSEAKARLLGLDRVVVRACTPASGLGADDPVAVAASRAYERAGIGPEDVDVVEVHDAASPAELIMYETLGLCAPGDGPRLLASGDTAIGGRIPVNPSGGLVGKGHPVGATGVAQIVELVEQLRGRGGHRQVSPARVALAENGGGYLGPHPAAATITILSR